MALKELSGKTVLITGASDGIGKAIAMSMAAVSTSLILVARNLEKLSLVSKEIREIYGIYPDTISVDLTNHNSVEAIKRMIQGHEHKPDILVNNAGGTRPIKYDAADNIWNEAFAINFEQVRKITNYCIPFMKHKKWGRVINITGSLEPLGFNAATVAKASVHAWAKGLSNEVAKFGITINSIAPGRINSAQINKLYPSEEIKKKFINKYIPIGYFGEPEDVAHLAVFLATDKARYITGEIIHVDGGMKRSAF